MKVPFDDNSPLVAGLGWYVLQFSTEVAGRWTVAREEVVPKGAGAAECSTCYCNRNSVNLATLVFGFQVLSGLITLASWFVMWWVDREDDAMEQLEDTVTAFQMQNKFLNKVR